MFHGCYSIPRTGSGATMKASTLALSSLPAFVSVKGLVIDSASGTLYMSATDTTTLAVFISKISVASQIVSTSTLAGGKFVGSSDGVGTNAAFRNDAYITLSSNGNLYVGDSGNNCIREIVIATQTVTTIAGSLSGTAASTDGLGTNACFNGLKLIADDSNGNLYVTEGGDGKIRKIAIASRNVTTLGFVVVNYFTNFISLVFGGSGKLFGVQSNTGGTEMGFRMKMIEIETGNMTSLPSIPVHYGNGATTDAFAMDAYGNMIITDLPAYRIRQYNLSAQSLTASYLVGSGQVANSIDGFGLSIQLSNTPQLAVDSTHGILYLYQDFPSCVRVVQTSAPCTAGKWCPPGSTALDQGGPCPAGYRCPQGMDRIGCPAGSYCTAVGASTTPQFLFCSAGSYCPIGSSALDQGGLCPGGYYCSAGGDRVPCTAGQYCPRGTAIQNGGGICSGGYYCAAAADRIQCPAGTYCAIGTTTPPQSCSAGSYCPAGSSVIDQAGPCPAGTFCAAGADRVNCTNGFYCPPGSATLDHGGACPAGYMCPPGVDRVPCTPGFACTGGLARMPCIPGTYAPAGSSACTQCPRGLVSASAGKS